MNAKTMLKRKRIARRPRPAFRAPSDNDCCPLVVDDLGVWVVHHCGAFPTKQWHASSHWRTR